MTETSCLIALTPPGDPVTGHVGPPSPACEVSAWLVAAGNCALQAGHANLSACTWVEAAAVVPACEAGRAARRWLSHIVLCRRLK